MRFIAAPEAVLLHGAEQSMCMQVDQPGSAIDTYLQNLSKIFKQKAQAVWDLQRRLSSFLHKLKAEENLSRAFGRRQLHG